MNCADLRLDEYLDGELADADRAVVDAHLASCAACRAELEHSKKLESVLRSVPTGAAPDADRFVQSVRLRSRRPSLRPLALAAALLIGLTGLIYMAAGGPVDLSAEIARYAAKPTPYSEERIKAAGPEGLAALERALDHQDVHIQFAAASLLFKLADGPTRERVLVRYQQRKEPSGAWTLSEPGAEDEDTELVPIAVSLAVNGQDQRALAMLQKLNRLNRQAQHKIVDAVVILLHSTSVDVQRHALEIVKTLDIEFPLSSIVELLDSPELGGEALRFLKQETKKDWGRDKQAWLREIRAIQ